MASEARRRLVAWASALLLLAVGAAAGAAAERVLLSGRGRGGPPGPPSPDAVVERMRRDLDLDAEQARRVRAIVAERHERFRTLFERIDPEAETLRRESDARIRALLTAEQRERFDRSVAEREARRAEMRRRLAPGPDGG